jgi:hypothetical protein
LREVKVKVIVEGCRWRPIKGCRELYVHAELCISVEGGCGRDIIKLSSAHGQRLVKGFFDV